MTSTVTTTIGGWSATGPPRVPGALSGLIDSSLGPRQTEALLPDRLEPAGQQAEQQDVLGTNTREQRRLVEDIRQAADRANKYLKWSETHLQFEVSQQTGQIVITVLDSETQEVVRQIPPESLQRMADHLGRLQGVLLEAQG